jgi:uridine phosphorylase
MMTDMPLYEFDPDDKAIINPGGDNPKRIEGAECCVLCFFKEVVDKAVREWGAVQIYAHKTEMGYHPVYRMAHKGRSISFLLSGVGAPLAAGLFDETIALGFTKFVACGGAGSLRAETEVGAIVIPSSALRDEGTSYHYRPPSRHIDLDEAVVAKLALTLERRGVPHVVGRTWTTDAFYRETKGKIESRMAEGCLTVDMECAAFAAVAAFRKVSFGQYLYCGDDVSGDAWDQRGWESRFDIRENLFWLAVEACLAL